METGQIQECWLISAALMQQFNLLCRTVQDSILDAESKGEEATKYIKNNQTFSSQEIKRAIRHDIEAVDRLQCKQTRQCNINVLSPEFKERL